LNACTLPVELWVDIFRDASSIPNKNEFGTDPRGYDNLILGQPVASSLLTTKELGVALLSRLHFVLVCKYWRDIGLPVLYSHFRLHVRPGDTVYQRIHEYLSENHRLTSAVRRVTIVIDGTPGKRAHSADMGELRKMHEGIISILSLFSRTKIITANPMLFWSMPPSIRSRVAIADLTAREIHCVAKFSTIGEWDGLVHLNLDLTSPFPFLRDKVTLPAVRSLDFRTARTTSASFIEKIATTWNAPKLHTVGLCAYRWREWRAFLERHASTIWALVVHDCPANLGFVMVMPPVQLPALRRLYLAHEAALLDPRKLVEAPLLHRVIIQESPADIAYAMDVPALRRSFITSWLVRDALQVWTSSATPIKSYYISIDDRHLRFLAEDPMVVEMVHALRRRGSEVYFLSDEGNCWVFSPKTA